MIEKENDAVHQVESQGILNSRGSARNIGERIAKVIIVLSGGARARQRYGTAINRFCVRTGEICSGGRDLDERVICRFKVAGKRSRLSVETRPSEAVRQLVQEDDDGIEFVARNLTRIC